MIITKAALDCQREPFARPLGFKGSSFREKWNAVVRLRAASGCEAYGLGGLAVLWSDAAVYAAHSEAGGNYLMLSLLDKALQLVLEQEYADPLDMNRALRGQIYEYGRQITGLSELRPTFAWISLVALDNAAWVLHTRESGITDFAQLIPPAARPALSHRQEHLLAVPTVAYNTPPSEIQAMLQSGAGMIKVKLGHPGAEEEMLAKDMARLREVHNEAVRYETPWTDSGHVLYYLDANGRYTRLESVQRLLEQAGRLGMLERIVILEEPFADRQQLNVASLPVRVAADESLHSPADVVAKAAQGYGAVAIKPAGKTLSMAFEMALAAHESGLPYYVADNACVPVLVDWNKRFAASMPAFPGVKGGLLESNGPESYANWPALLAMHPRAGAGWLRPQAGVFELDNDFYASSGGIFLDPPMYAGLPLLAW